MGEQDKLDRLPSVLPWVVGGAALGLVIAYVWTFHTLPTSESPPAWGAFGDYVGGILNPLVSTFTLIVAVKVWQLQKKEMADTRKLVDDQTKTAERQRQEQRFFDLLNTYHRTLDAISYDKGMSRAAGDPLDQLVTFRGREAIREWLSSHRSFGEFIQPFGRYVAHEPLPTSEVNKPLLDQFALEWGGSSEVSDRFGPYLRTVDKILATANLVLTNHKLEYLHLFRAQLSNSELALIGYQVLLGQEGSELQKNVEQFGLLANLSHGDLRSALSDRLSTSAFTYSIETSQGNSPC